MDEVGGIPQFDDHGNLPEGVYDCTEASFEEAFVTPFFKSTVRGDLFSGFKRLRMHAQNVSPPATQWVDGSFVTTKQEPDDVDILTFVDYDTMNKLPRDKIDEVYALLGAQESTKRRFKCHTFLELCCPPGHSQYRFFERERNYWLRWFGTTRETERADGTIVPGNPKGFVQIALGRKTEAPEISGERPA